MFLFWRQIAWVFCCLLIEAVIGHSISDIKQLQRQLKTPVLSDSFFTPNFNTFQKLKMKPTADKIPGVRYVGKSTVNALKAMFAKALQGKNVTILILGGSSSQGADLGITSQSQTFHKALYSWWENIITPLTGSFLSRRNAAIGGVCSGYMSFCWKEYIRGLPFIDLVIWEFFINDPDTTLDVYRESLNRFIKSVSEFPSRPGLIFVKFCKNSLFFGDRIGNPVCNEKYKDKDLAVVKVLRKFSISEIDELKIVCDYMSAHPEEVLLKKDYFINHHPSHLLHAQIGYAIISHIRNQFLTFLSSVDKVFKEAEQYRNSKLVQTLPESRCYTAVTPHVNFTNINSIYALPKLWRKGFKVRSKYHWNPVDAVRFDVRGGYMSTKPNSYIAFLLDDQFLTKRSNLYILISRQEKGGTIEVRVKSKNIGEIKTLIDCSRNMFPGTSLDKIASNVIGPATIQVDDPKSPCLINAIIVEESL